MESIDTALAAVSRDCDGIRRKKIDGCKARPMLRCFYDADHLKPHCISIDFAHGTFFSLQIQKNVRINLFKGTDLSEPRVLVGYKKRSRFESAPKEETTIAIVYYYTSLENCSPKHWKAA